MSGFISMIEGQLSFAADEVREGTVVMRGRREHRSVFGIHMSPDQARQLAAELIASANKIAPLSTTPPADPLAASLPAPAGGDFSSEVTP